MHRLPGAIQKPILHELTPLKELFLQQRPARLLLAGSGRMPMAEVVHLLFTGSSIELSRDILFEVFRWQTLELKDRGTVSVLDARGAADETADLIRDELKRESADAIVLVTDAADGRTRVRQSIENGSDCLHWNDEFHPNAGVVAVHLDPPKAANANGDTPEPARVTLDPRTQDRLWGNFHFVENSPKATAESQRLLRLLAEKLSNECRVEIVRISGDRVAQREIAGVLIKSTTAICTAIGAQPIPLADLPILTTLQLIMVSGVMYVSGRERSLRAATEFLGAIGANVGAGMLLREGTRAILKFFPGWGNLVCGAVAGAGTYAIGQAAAAYFLDGVTLRDARRTYLTRRRQRKQLPVKTR